MAEEKKKMSTGKKVLIGVGIYCVVAGAALAIASQTESFKNAGGDSPQAGSAATAEKQNKIAWKKAGMYKVGAELPAGEYVIQPRSEAAYYEVSADSSGSLESIITNDTFSGGTVFVTVKNGQYLTVRAARFAEAEQYEVPAANPIPQGMYRVGRDIPSGEYKITSADAINYYAVQKDSYNTLGSIITNDTMFEGSKYITVRDGQYLLLKNCSAGRVE